MWNVGDNMTNDLKIIKKHYGERMSQLCRELFPTLLETEGLLSALLLDHFEPTHSLYDDIIKEEKQKEFQSFLYSFIEDKEEAQEEVQVKKTPEELLDEAGYTLYRCNSEEEIKNFRKYYIKEEELCTFNGGRLNNWYVFFAVKKNVEDIKRENFSHPERQDEYGTSVISIQFKKDNSHTLSIKNRYNHKVENPDSTFSNNLDNIIPGLTESFAKYYGLKQSFDDTGFELKGYVEATDGKFYQYNQEINNIYYCPNNIVIDNFEVRRYEKERYILFEHFILDLKEKTISSYDKTIRDSFLKTIKKINKIEIKKDRDYKNIVLFEEDGTVVELTINQKNQLIQLQNNDITQIDDRFLYYNRELKKLILPNVIVVGKDFLYSNIALEQLELSKVTSIGTHFLHYNENLETLSVPKLTKIENYFLYHNKVLKEIDIRNVNAIGSCFLYSNETLKELILPNVVSVGPYFLYFNVQLNKIELPKATVIGSYFLCFNQELQKVELPNVIEIGYRSFFFNTSLKEVILPKVLIIGDEILKFNENLEAVEVPTEINSGLIMLDSSMCSKSKQKVKE